MGVFEILCGFVIFLFLLYRYLTATFDFWKKRGVPGPDPVLYFGTMKDIILKKEFAGIHWKRMYDTYEDAQFVGLFNMRKPVLLVKDPKYIKDILMKDSSLFPTRGFPYNMHAEPLLPFLFYTDGTIARFLRAKVSPTFTPNKLKEMSFTMHESFTRLYNYVDSVISKDDYMNCNDVAVRLLSDIIGRCLMDIDVKTLSMETNELDIISSNDQLQVIKETKGILKKIFMKMLLSLSNLVGYNLFHNDKYMEFYKNFVHDVVEHRKKHNIIKRDLISVLMALKENPGQLGDVIGKSFFILACFIIPMFNLLRNRFATDMTDEFFCAEIFAIFTAGYELSSSVLINALYELALNQNVQDKLRDEIRNLFAENGELTYDTIKSMSYLHAVFKETTRKYPVIESMLRCASTSYTFRDTNVTIPKGQTVLIPTYAIHHDPKVYPKPEVFDPERFCNEADRSRDPMYHMPFGYGTRSCIGERVGILETKMSIAAFIRKYKVDVCEKTITSYDFYCKHGPLLGLSSNPIYLKVTKID